MSRPRAAERFYRGLWKVLVDVFKVPPEGPRLPSFAGEEHTVFHPAPGFLSWLKFHFWLVFLMIDAALLVALIAIWVEEPVAGAVLTPVFLVLMVVPDLIAYVAIHLRFDATWYVLTPRSVHMRRGIFVLDEVTITFANVQNIELSSGPLQRHFGIGDLVVETAGAGSDAQGHRAGIANQGVIQGVANAPEIRDLIMARVRRQRGTGLGDDHGLPGRAPDAWTPAHLAALREIREAAAALPDQP